MNMLTENLKIQYCFRPYRQFQIMAEENIMVARFRIGPDNNVYYIVGEVGGHRTQAQNIEDGPAPNGLGGVLRITQDGDVVDPANPIFGDESPLNLYYAMGIRNSFGMDFDPVTGNLWDTENGPTAGDEINLLSRI